MAEVAKLRIIMIGGTSRTLRTLQAVTLREDVKIVMAIFQRDYPWDTQWHAELEDLAKRESIPFETYDSGERLKQELVASVRSLEPDVIIGGGNWRSLLPAELWKTTRYGYIGLHGSLLPEYRGFANLNWHIINGEKQYGMQMYQLNEGVDSGPLVYRGDGTPIRAYVSLREDRTVADIVDEIDRRYAESMLELIDALRQGDVIFVRQDESRATWACHRGPEDGEIDWTRPTRKLYDFIRAQSHPFPGAYSFYKNEKFHIWKATVPTDPKNFVGRIAGKVVDRRPDNHVDVLTGDGVLRIEEITVQGEAIPPSKFLDSARQTLGYRSRQAIEDAQVSIAGLESKIEALERALQR